MKSAVPATKKKDLIDDGNVIEVTWNGVLLRESIPTNLTLADLTPQDLREALNKCPGKYAYWAHRLALVNHRLAILEAEYEMWYARKVANVELPKRGGYTSESAKKNAVMLDHPEEVKSYYKSRRDTELLRDKISVLVKAYEMQSRTLQTISGLVKAEMDTLGGARGKRDLVKEE